MKNRIIKRICLFVQFKNDDKRLQAINKSKPFATISLGSVVRKSPLTCFVRQLYYVLALYMCVHKNRLHSACEIVVMV